MGKKVSLAVEQVYSSALELKAEGVGLTLDTLLTKECRQRAGSSADLK